MYSEFELMVSLYSKPITRKGHRKGHMKIITEFLVLFGMFAVGFLWLSIAPEMDQAIIMSMGR